MLVLLNLYTLYINYRARNSDPVCIIKYPDAGGPGDGLILALPAYQKGQPFMNPRNYFIFPLCLAVAVIFSCNKAATHPSGPGTTTPRQILYLIKGTNFNLNFIDSSNNFQQNVTMVDSFHYSFKKGAGGNIGISILRYTPADIIYSWEIYIDGKLYANAFSEGGAYMVVPYTLF
jgi:hypothetical protein